MKYAMMLWLSVSMAAWGQYAFTNFVGLGGGAGSVDGLGNAARFRFPSAVALDYAGNIYVADTGNHLIRKVSAAGVVTTLAGMVEQFDVAGSPIGGSADGMGTAARFNGPGGVAVDSGGNIYVADTGNHTIRKISSVGMVTTLTGSGGIPGNADGSGQAARFNQPSGVAVDNVGNVYVADTGNHTIRQVNAAGAVTTLAGSAGIPGNVDGLGTAARFKGPAGVAVDSVGNVYVADTGNYTIRKISSVGMVTILAGSGRIPGTADGAGNVARFDQPSGVAVDSAGNLYVADTDNNTIRKVSATELVTTVAGLVINNPGPWNFQSTAGSTDGVGNVARFNMPTGVAADSMGNVYVADYLNHTIRKVNAIGAVTTLAGSASKEGSADGAGSMARFCGPAGVAVDNVGNLFVADTDNYTIRKVTAAGMVTTLAGRADGLDYQSNDGIGSAARFYIPSGVATDRAGNLYVADSGNHTIRKVTTAGVVTTLAGLAGQLGSADGKGSAARFFSPVGVAVDSAGNVYVTDSGNHTIRKVSAAGMVITLAGLAGGGGGGHVDGLGNLARFENPYGVAVDDAGNIYVTDRDNNTIRKVSAAGMVATIAGSSMKQGSVDGTGSAARFNYSCGIAVDSAHNLYVADTWNNTIRKITSAGVVSTVGGGLSPGSADGVGSVARFNQPSGIAIDRTGNLYVADTGNNRISKGILLPDGYSLAVTVNPIDGGSVVANPSSPNGHYVAQTQVTLTAQPANGYQLIGWSGDASGTSTSTTLTMNGNKSVTAKFSNTTIPGNVATISLNNWDVDQPIYYLNAGNPPPAGTQVELLAGPMGGSLTPVASLFSEATVFAVDDSGHFDNSVGIVNGLLPNGTGQFQVRAWVGAVSYTTATIRGQTPVFQQGTGAWNSFATPLSPPLGVPLRMPASIILRKVTGFRLYVTGNPEMGGDWLVQPSPGLDGTYPENTELTLTAVPVPGYQFSRWSGDVPSGQAQVGWEHSNPLPHYVMDQDKTITGYFERLPLRLDVFRGLPGHLALSVIDGQVEPYLIETSIDLRNWSPIATNFAGPTGSLDWPINTSEKQRFFRVHLGAGTVNTTLATVSLNNYDSQSPLYYLTVGSLVPAGTWVELLGGTVGGAMAAVYSTYGPATQFLVTTPGYFDAGVGIVPEVAGGDWAQFQLLVWQGASTYDAAPVRGQSPVFEEPTGSWNTNSMPPSPPQGPALALPNSVVIRNIVP